MGDALAGARGTYSKRRGHDYVDTTVVGSLLERLKQALKRAGINYLHQREFNSWRDLAKDMSREYWRTFDGVSIDDVQEGLKAAFAKVDQPIQITLRLSDARKPRELLLRARHFQRSRRYQPPLPLEKLHRWKPEKRKYWLDLVREAVRCALNGHGDLGALTVEFGPEIQRYYVDVSDSFDTSHCIDIAQAVIHSLRKGMDVNLLALWLHEAAVAHTDAGQTAQAVTLCDEALALDAAQIDDARRGHLFHRRAILHVRHGDLTSARRLLARAAWCKHAAWRKHSIGRHEVWSTLSMTAVVDELSGRLLDAERRQRRCMIKAPGYHVAFRLARVLRKLGKFSDAIKLAAHAHKQTDVRNMHRIAFRLSVERCLSCHFSGRTKDARQALRDARRHAEKCENLFGGPGTRLNYALASMLVNRPNRVHKVDSSVLASLGALMAGGFAYRGETAPAPSPKTST